MLSTWFKVQLNGVSFAGATLLGAIFSRVSGNNVDFCKAALEQATFHRVTLRGANFKKANLVNANFFYADLTGACFDGADLTGACLVGAKLDGASFVQTIMHKTNLSSASVKDALFQNLCFYDVITNNCDLSTARFIDVSFVYTAVPFFMNTSI